MTKSYTLPAAPQEKQQKICLLGTTDIEGL